MSLFIIPSSFLFGSKPNLFIFVLLLTLTTCTLFQTSDAIKSLGLTADSCDNERCSPGYSCICSDVCFCIADDGIQTCERESDCPIGELCFQACLSSTSLIAVNAVSNSMLESIEESAEPSEEYTEEPSQEPSQEPSEEPIFDMEERSQEPQFDIIIDPSPSSFKEFDPLLI